MELNKPVQNNIQDPASPEKDEASSPAVARSQHVEHGESEGPFPSTQLAISLIVGVCLQVFCVALVRSYNVKGSRAAKSFT